MALQRALRQVVWGLFLALLLLGVPRLAGQVADLIDFSRMDPDGAFGWIGVHHIVQAVIFLMSMVAIEKTTDVRFGFGWGDSKVGLFYVRLFALIFGAYALISSVIMIVAGSFQAFPYPLTARNMAGQLGFQLLLSGPSEGLIFRAFAITMFALLLKGAVVSGEAGVSRVIQVIFGSRISVANLIAAIIFGLAHVRFTFAPFSASYSLFQVVYATVLGLFYGVCYERSKSMFYPMAMHSISNVVAVGMAILAGFVSG